MKTALAYESSGTDTVRIANSKGDAVESGDISTLLDWLRYSKTGGAIRVVWSLDSFIAPVMKHLPIPVLERIAANDGDLVYDGHELFFFSKRVFRVGRSWYYGLEEFWPTSEAPPATLEELQDKADELMETLAHCGLGDTTGLTSPVSCFEKTEMGREFYEAVPKGHEIPPSCFEMLEYADKSDRREWITAYQVGHWESLPDYDISSCYASEASKLPHTDDMTFWKATSMSGREWGAEYGFLKGMFYIYPDHPFSHCSPVMLKGVVSGMDGNPAGLLPEDYFSLAEVRFIEHTGLGYFLMMDGWFMSHCGGVSPRRPFRELMDNLYQRRHWSPLASSVMKGVANQLVGKLIERRVRGDTFGDIYNGLYHAIVTSEARVKVARFLIDNEVTKEELVVVQTDGCRVNRIIATPKRNGMGTWRLNGEFPTLVASPRLVLSGDKKPQHLTYDQVVSLIKEHPLDAYYGREVNHRVTLKQAVEWNDIGLVGELIDLPAHLDLFSIPRQQNRVFKKLPVTGRALLGGRCSSEPVILGT